MGCLWYSAGPEQALAQADIFPRGDGELHAHWEAPGGIPSGMPGCIPRKPSEGALDGMPGMLEKRAIAALAEREFSKTNKGEAGVDGSTTGTRKRIQGQN